MQTYHHLIVYPAWEGRAPYLEGASTAPRPHLHHSTPSLCSPSVHRSTAGHGRHAAAQHSKSGCLRWNMAFGHSRSRRCPRKPVCALHLDNTPHLSNHDNNNHCKKFLKYAAIHNWCAFQSCYRYQLINRVNTTEYCHVGVAKSQYNPKLLCSRYKVMFIHTCHFKKTKLGYLHSFL